jgi:hypothetical protein
MLMISALYALMASPMLLLYIVLGFKWTQRPKSYKIIRSLLIFGAAMFISYPGLDVVHAIAPDHVFPALMFGLCAGLVVVYFRAAKYD